jgi:DnaK suppressor protein
MHATRYKNGKDVFNNRGLGDGSPPSDLAHRRSTVKKTKHSASAKAKAKTQAPVKKPVSAKTKTAVKKPAPVKKAAVKKPLSAKPAPKKTAAKKAVPAKAATKPSAVKKPAAKKAVPSKKPATKKTVAVKKAAAKKPATKKPVPKKVTPAKKAVVKTPTASRTGKVSKAPAKTLPAAKKSTPAKTAPSSVTSATKSSSVKNDKASAKAVAVKPSQPTAPAVEVAKKSPRAAKAMAMMPPPPGQSVASTTAKSSYGPIMVPSLPAVVPVVPVKNPKLANNWKNTTPDKVTDEEVIAMSDDDYMNAFQMAFFRHKLVQLKNDILINAGETTEHLREDTVIVPDPADRATIEEEHALELRTRDRERKLLKKIEQSISRIDSGDYGYCDETGEPIGVGRLIARPTATLSLEAQQRRELKQKMFGD